MNDFQKHKEVSFLAAISWILISVIVINGSFFLGLSYYKTWKQHRRENPKYHLVALVTKCTKGEPLNFACLSEWLHLSIDRPVHFDDFIVQEKEKELRSHPIIEKASIQKIPPGSVFVSYQLREPIAYLADYENTAIDKEGILFPFNPYLSPKKLPKIRLGLHLETVFGQKVEGLKVETAFSLLQRLQLISTLQVMKIDVSRMLASSAGRQEIVVELEELHDVDRKFRILRLCPEMIDNGLKRYKKLLLHNPKQTIIDLRLKQLAYLN